MNFKNLFIFLNIFLITNCQIIDNKNILMTSIIDKNNTSAPTFYVNNKLIAFKNDGTYKSDEVWFNDLNKYILVLRSGKIVQTHGLKKNVEIFDLNIKNIFEEIIIGNIQELEYTIRLSNPDSGFLPVTSVFSLEDKLFLSDNNVPDTYKYLIKEEFNTKSIRWRGINYYWLDGDANVIWSFQSIHPDKIDIEYKNK